jgi:tetratricopeptide (TPR) repeat protein
MGLAPQAGANTKVKTVPVSIAFAGGARQMFHVLMFALLVAAQAPPETVAAEPPSAQASQDEDIVIPAKKQGRLWLEGLEAFKAGRYAEAEAKLYTLEQRVELGARSEALLLEELTVQPQSGKRQNFILTVDQIPDEGAAIVYVRGIAQARQGKLAQAAGAMRETMRIDSKFFDAYADLALIQVLRGRPDLARRQLKPMAKLISKCDYNCAEKQARYERVRELAADGAE